MKKLLVLILLAALLLTVCACTSSGVYEADGLRLTVDWDLYQISDGQHVYNYSCEQTSDGEKIVITYPNGAQYFVIIVDGTVLATGSAQAGDISDYISPETLFAAIDDQRPMSAMVFQGFDGYDIIMFILAACIIIVGLFVVSDPEVAWKMRFDWLVENVELTDRALSVIRFCGVCTTVSGIGLIAYTIFSAFK